MIPANHAFARWGESVYGSATSGCERTVHFLEHVIHALDVVVIEEPCLRVLLVLFERDTEGIGDVDTATWKRVNEA